MDSRVLSAKLRRLDLKLDRFNRVLHDMYELVLALDVKVDAVLLAQDCEESWMTLGAAIASVDERSSETLGSSSTTSSESEESDMSFVVSDHSSDADDPPPADTSSSGGSSDSESS
mmetsp:Transcript_18555/g.43727  ORF Transcript_18555/g.43727 Transcript_18555/m.43727 type:complete len:116 (+) Transcript_18555:66-413(+)